MHLIPVDYGAIPLKNARWIISRERKSFAKGTELENGFHIRAKKTAKEMRPPPVGNSPDWVDERQGTHEKGGGAKQQDAQPERHSKDEPDDTFKQADHANLGFLVLCSIDKICILLEEQQLLERRYAPTQPTNAGTDTPSLVCENYRESLELLRSKLLKIMSRGTWQ
jgi:hypothetical protein